MSKIKLSKKLGIILLGIWLILTGLLQFVSIQIPHLDIMMVMGILAIASGALILLDQ
jgi:uncharacterized membrane protein HdeD (DUF308 family)